MNNTKKEAAYQAIDSIIDELIAVQKEAAEYRAALIKIGNLNFGSVGDQIQNIEWLTTAYFNEAVQTAIDALRRADATATYKQTR